MRAFLFTLAIGFAFTATPAAACKAPKYTRAEKQIINPARIKQSLVSSAITKASNYQRCKAGKSKLRHDKKLQSVASTRAKAMSKQRKLSHLAKGSLKRDIRRSGVRTKVFAENIAEAGRLRQQGRLAFAVDVTSCQFRYGDKQPIPVMTYASLAENVVGRWVQSKDHRYNLMYHKIRSIGSGAAYGTRKGHLCGLFYVSQTFAD